MVKVWIIYTLAFGYPLPTSNSKEFDTRAGCEAYMGASYGLAIIDAFKLVCSTK